MPSVRLSTLVVLALCTAVVALQAEGPRTLNSLRDVGIVPGYLAHEKGPDVRLRRSIGMLPAEYYPEQGDVHIVTFNPADTAPELAVAIRILNSTYRVDSTGPERREVYAALTQRPAITPRIARYLLESSEAIPLLHYSYSERSGAYFITAEVPPEIDTETFQQLLLLVGSEAVIRSLALSLDTMEAGIHPQIRAMFTTTNAEDVDNRLATALTSTGLTYEPKPRGLFELGFIDSLRPEPIMLYAESATLALGALEFRNIYALITAWPTDANANEACVPLLTLNEDPLKFGNLSIAAAGNGSVPALFLSAYVPANCSPQHLATYLQRLAGQAASVRNYLAE